MVVLLLSAWEEAASGDSISSKRTPKRNQNHRHHGRRVITTAASRTNEQGQRAKTQKYANKTQKQVFLTERFDEGLMIMRRLLGWDMIDMTYSRMMETKAGARRWDGKELKNVPKWDDLPKWVSAFGRGGGRRRRKEGGGSSGSSKAALEPVLEDVPGVALILAKDGCTQEWGGAASQGTPTQGGPARGGKRDSR